jgi:hypothetical protein
MHGRLARDPLLHITHIPTTTNPTPIMKLHGIVASAVLLAALPATAGTTIATLDEPQMTVTTDSGWRVSTSMYVWTTRLDGDITVHGNTAPVDIDFTDIFDNLDFCFMGLVEVGKGRWSFMTDLFYAKLSPSNSTRLATFDTEIEQFIGNFAVFYRAYEDERSRIDIYGGARVNWMETDLDVRFRNGATLSTSGSKTWVDPIIGVRFNHDFTDKLFVRAVADVGGFNVSSDLTWQAMVALGYHLNDKVSVALGYRAIYTDYTSGDITYDVTSHGLLLGLNYRF